MFINAWSRATDITNMGQTKLNFYFLQRSENTNKPQKTLNVYHADPSPSLGRGLGTRLFLNMRLIVYHYIYSKLHKLEYYYHDDS